MIETLLFAVGLNVVMFLLAYWKKTDKLTDISYAVTFFGIAVYGVYRNDMNPVQWLAVIIVTIWAIRLGSFLLYRVSIVGKDKRFDVMRNNFFLFGRFWLLQGLTAWVVMAPVSYILINNRSTRIDTLAIIGALIALSGIAIEGIADLQKFRFNQDKKNKGKWIAEGIWKYSRHPNYFGEMLMWYGMYWICYPWLTTEQAIFGLASPLLITILLIGVSGIPILEKSADERWGKDKAYRDYKRKTSILVPLPLKKQ